MCEGLSTLNGPIPAHPMFLKEPAALSVASARTTSNNSLCEGPSKISGPLVSHYGYENSDDLARKSELDFSKNPRVRDAGKLNFDSHKNGNGVALLIELQGRSIVPQTYKLREPPKNHIASNALRIKQLMRKAKEKETQKQKESLDRATPVKALWKSEKYKDVPSKLKELLQQQPLAPRESMATPTKTFLRAHSRTGSLSRPQTARDAPREAIGEASAAIANCQRFGSKDDIDFVKHNQMLAKQAQLKRAPSVEMLKQVQQKLNNDLEKYHSRIKGKIPQYLEQRKQDAMKDHENYMRSLPDPEQPPGHRKLPNDEKEKTLALLQETHKKLIGELNSMPIRNDTLRLRNSKSELEKKLIELDEAIKIFSRPKVFVKVDE